MIRWPSMAWTLKETEISLQDLHEGQEVLVWSGLPTISTRCAETYENEPAWRRAKIVHISKKRRDGSDYRPEIEFPGGFTASIHPKHIRAMSDNNKTVSIDPEHIEAAKRSYIRVTFPSPIILNGVEYRVKRIVC
jgi:hypothetical protein